MKELDSRASAVRFACTVAMALTLLVTLSACRTMELGNKTILLNPGDTKAKVLEVMGTPKDRQFLGDYEVWQYCITGAGFGYHDYSVVWLRHGQVTGITSYKDTTPASRCEAQWYKRFRIPLTALPEVEEHLFQVNIHDLSLFPDAEGLAGFVRQKLRLHLGR